MMSSHFEPTDVAQVMENVVNEIVKQEVAGRSILL